MRSAMCPRPRILISIEPSSVCLHVSGVSSSMVSQLSILDCGKPNNCQLPLVAGAKMEATNADIVVAKQMQPCILGTQRACMQLALIL